MPFRCPLNYLLLVCVLVSIAGLLQYLQLCACVDASVHRHANALCVHASNGLSFNFKPFKTKNAAANVDWQL